MFLVYRVLRDFADLNRVLSFRRVRNFKSHFVTFAERVKRYADELIGVEKEIFFLSIALDEPETPVGESGDSSFLHVCNKKSG